jgi:hypothetical protein
MNWEGRREKGVTVMEVGWEEGDFIETVKNNKLTREDGWNKCWQYR